MRSALRLLDAIDTGKTIGHHARSIARYAAERRQTRRGPGSGNALPDRCMALAVGAHARNPVTVGPGHRRVENRARLASASVWTSGCRHEALGLRTEVVLGVDDGLPRQSAIRCDFLTLMFKRKPTGFVATLPHAKQIELRAALVWALQLDR
jgi:hypothetical protein